MLIGIVWLGVVAVALITGSKDLNYLLGGAILGTFMVFAYEKN
jgi:hypothetical protein